MYNKQNGIKEINMHNVYLLAKNIEIKYKNKITNNNERVCVYIQK